MVSEAGSNAAAIKAFLVNRVGDFGFALGIFGTYLLFDTIVLDEIFILAPKYVETELTFLWFSADAITVLTMLLFIGAMGKSAQLGLHRGSRMRWRDQLRSPL